MAPRIELKNIKHSEFASQETHCYQATLYIDGKKVGMVGNEGHGGPDFFYPDAKSDRAIFDAAEAEVAKENCPGYDFPNSIEIICGDLVNEWLVTKDFKRLVARKALFTVPGEAGLFQMGYKGKAKPDERLYAIVRERNPGAVVLNEMPVDEAVKIFRKAA